MGVVVDTPGAVTCALRGRPKSEGIAVHTWSCDGSLAGPLLLEFIVGWSCVGTTDQRQFFLNYNCSVVARTGLRTSPSHRPSRRAMVETRRDRAAALDSR